MESKELEKVCNDLTDTAGIIAIMTKTGSYTREEALTVISGMVMFVTHEHHIPPRLAASLLNTLSKNFDILVESIPDDMSELFNE